MALLRRRQPLSVAPGVAGRARRRDPGRRLGALPWRPLSRRRVRRRRRAGARPAAGAAARSAASPAAGAATRAVRPVPPAPPPPVPPPAVAGIATAAGGVGGCRRSPAPVPPPRWCPCRRWRGGRAGAAASWGRSSDRPAAVAVSAPEPGRVRARPELVFAWGWRAARAAASWLEICSAGLHEVLPDDRRIGAALDRLRRCTAGHRDELVREPDPHGGRDLRRPAHEPGVAVVGGGARLAGDVDAGDRPPTGPVPCWTTPCSSSWIVWATLTGSRACSGASSTRSRLPWHRITGTASGRSPSDPRTGAPRIGV